MGQPVGFESPRSHPLLTTVQVPPNPAAQKEAVGTSMLVAAHVRPMALDTGTVQSLLELREKLLV